VNLGHFGGAAKQLDSATWPVLMADIAVAHENVYVDTGNHKVHDAKLASAYLGALANLLDPSSSRAEMLHRIMFGSDWFMLAVYPNHHKFLSTYEALFDKHFGSGRTSDFLGRNALRFLGLDRAGTGNARRLRTFYARQAPGNTPDWLPTEPTQTALGDGAGPERGDR
jgi:predicted TIM-barrel fold metal-dependent hydrolase